MLKFFPLFSEILLLDIELFFQLILIVLVIFLEYFVAVALHNLIGLFLGFLIASFLKFPMDVKKTVAIEVTIQNSG